MIIDIFSSFDPHILSSFNYLPTLWWLCLIFSFPFLIDNFWIKGSFISPLIHSFISTINQQSSRSSLYKIKRATRIIIPLFLFILTFNILGLFPYSFRFSNHLFFTLSFGLPLWLSFILSSFRFNFYQARAILLPPGAPDILNPFLVIVETIRTLVRPLTLSFRLAANITAGHVILGLIGSYLSSIILSSFFISSFLIILISGYIIFEFAICGIQAYVFCLLLNLYADDHSF